MKRQEREYLNQLSKKLYGSSSKWQRMVNKGEKAPMEEIMEDGTSRKYTGIHYQTLEEVKSLMEQLSKEEDELQAKQELENKENEAAKKELEAEAEKQKAMIKEKTGEVHDPVKDVLETVGD